MRRLSERLFEPRDIRPLAFLRIALGLVLLADFAGHVVTGDVEDAYVAPIFHFKYYGFEWVEPWGGGGMYIHFHIVAALALSFALGLFYRASAVLLFLGVTYVFLLEQSEYLNHYYLVCLLCFLFVFLPAHRGYSLDAFRKPDLRSQTVPAWTLALLRAQLSIVYIYAGFAKLNPDWLRGEPLRRWLASRSDLPVIGPFLDDEWAAYFFSYGGLLLDLLVVPLLLWKRTRIIGFTFALFFHLVNAAVFEIGIFPWLMIAATLLLFSDDDVPESVARSAPPPPVGARRRVVLAFLSVYMAVQVLVPFRHFLYPGDVAWTEEGHRFSWRMKLRGKTGAAKFIASDPVSGRRWEVDPSKHLTRRQLRKMAGQPDMVLQFAHHLARLFREQGFPAIQVRARVETSLNGRRAQPLVDPEVDLAAQPRNLLPARWILPLREPLRRERADP